MLKLEIRHDGRRALALALAGLLAVTGVVPLARTTRAATTFTVNLASNQGDRTATDGRCDVSPDDGDQCTLRAAIQQANATGGTDTIAFNIPGPGVHTIQPTVPLPPINEAVTIDGYTQPESSQNTAPTGTNAVLRIELNGDQAGSADGLLVRAENTLVRGLVINGFDTLSPTVGAGVRFEGRGRSRVVGSFLGTDPTGTVARPNLFGVRVDGRGVSATIGGDTPAARNLISGNIVYGANLFEAGNNNVIQGNLIGTDASGTAALGNGDGVHIFATSNATIGGDTPGTANTIAFNLAVGVNVFGNAGNVEGNRILRNSIFQNAEFGIDLRGNGRDNNDFKDPDGLANNQQNYPILSSVVTAGTGTTIRGRLNSTPNRTFILRFFANPADGEGKTYLAVTSVQTDGSGNAAFVVRPVSAVPEGQNVTATATSQTGDTSEFSGAETAT